MVRFAKRLLVVVLFVGGGTWGSASAVTKKVARKPSTKVASKAVTPKTTSTAPVAGGQKVVLSPAVLVAELGPLKGTPENVRAQLIEKWGFPGWWPSPVGRIVNVTHEWTIASDSSGNLRKSLRVFADSALTIEQLASQLAAPADLVRKAAVTGLPGEQAIQFEKNGRDVLEVRLTVRDKSVADGKYEVSYRQSTFWDAGAMPIFTPPSPSLAKLSNIPPGASVYAATFQLSVQRFETNPDGSAVEVSTPDAPVYGAQVSFENAPVGYLDQVRKSGFPGFVVDANVVSSTFNVDFTNWPARQVYGIKKLDERRFSTYGFHTFLPGEVLPG